MLSTDILFDIIHLKGYPAKMPRLKLSPLSDGSEGTNIQVAQCLL